MLRRVAQETMIERSANVEGAGFRSDWRAEDGTGSKDDGRTTWFRQAVVTVLMGVTLGWALLAVGTLVLILTVVTGLVRGGRWLAKGRTVEPSILREAQTIVEHALERA